MKHCQSGDLDVSRLSQGTQAKTMASDRVGSDVSETWYWLRYDWAVPNLYPLDCQVSIWQTPSEKYVPQYRIYQFLRSKSFAMHWFHSKTSGMDRWIHPIRGWSLTLFENGRKCVLISSEERVSIAPIWILSLHLRPWNQSLNFRFYAPYDWPWTKIEE